MTQDEGPLGIRVSCTLWQAYGFASGKEPAWLLANRSTKEIAYQLQKRLIMHARDYAWAFGLVPPDEILRVTVWLPSIEADETGASALIALKPEWMMIRITDNSATTA